MVVSNHPYTATGLDDPACSSPYPNPPFIAWFLEFCFIRTRFAAFRCSEFDALNLTDPVGAIIYGLLAGALVVGALVLMVLFRTTPILARSRFPVAAAMGRRHSKSPLGITRSPSCPSPLSILSRGSVCFV